MVRLIVICLLLSGCAHDHFIYRHDHYYDKQYPPYPQQYHYRHNHRPNYRH